MVWTIVRHLNREFRNLHIKWETNEILVNSSHYRAFGLSFEFGFLFTHRIHLPWPWLLRRGLMNPNPSHWWSVILVKAWTDWTHFGLRLFRYSKEIEERCRGKLNRYQRFRLCELRLHTIKMIILKVGPREGNAWDELLITTLIFFWFSIKVQHLNIVFFSDLST